MRWKQDSKIGRIDGKDAIVILRDGASLQESDFARDALDDLLRASLSLGVSALDRYMHERVTKSIVSSLKRDNLSKPQREFSIPAAEAIRITEKVREARKKQVAIRPANEVRKAVQELLHKRPIQSWSDIDWAFKLIGISNVRGQLQAKLKKSNVDDEQTHLNTIVQKRNLIVHEADLVRHERGGKLRRNPIDRKFVEESLKFLDEFIKHLDEIT